MKQHEFARQLRRRMTDSETLLWYFLRDHRMNGQKFRRQQPIGEYIVDFVHFGARLIVEADGSQHLRSESDQQRDAWLKAQGFRVLRFWNDDILLRTQAVREAIWVAICAAPSPPTPLPQGERGAGVQTGMIGNKSDREDG
ncbi:MAG: endonuclease domain-containing protein [Gammaproteobacteria bacterium]|nr:MAG: endonuclease domain-containing protein [Gammaproteobacteria bacterium]